MEHAPICHVVKEVISIVQLIVYLSQNAATSLIQLTNFVTVCANHLVLAVTLMSTFASLMEKNNAGPMSTVVMSTQDGAQQNL